MSSPRRSPTQTTLDVISTAWLSPGLVRVTAGGEGFAHFTDRPETDKYVKIYFPPTGSTLVPPYDMAALRDELPFEALPVMRTYTVRRVDHERRELAIDFVVHGDTGIAGPWAAQAKPGDTLTFSGPGAAFLPDPAADALVLIGDESALPAVCATLDAVPADTRVIALIETRSAKHRIPLPECDGARVTWIDEDHAAPGSRLVAAVSAMDWPQGRVQAFAHGERGAMKQLRPILAGRGIARSDLSLSAYWALGRTEDSFQAEKRLPIGQIFPT